MIANYLRQATALQPAELAELQRAFNELRSELHLDDEAGRRRVAAAMIENYIRNRSAQAAAQAGRNALRTP